MSKSIRKVRQAIEIQGYIPMCVSGQEHQLRAIKTAGNQWVTDIMTPDLCGYVRVSERGKESLTAKAERIIADAERIRAEREEKTAAALHWAQHS